MSKRPRDFEKHHKVRVHRWRDGVLDFEDRFFQSVEDCLLYFKHSGGHSAKIFDENDQIVHETNSNNTDTYA